MGRGVVRPRMDMVGEREQRGRGGSEKREGGTGGGREVGEEGLKGLGRWWVMGGKRGRRLG